MSRISRRMTMGHDSCAKRKINPDGVPRISSQQVKARAKQLGIELKRDGMMWLRKVNGVWYNGYQTNYLMLEFLESGEAGKIWGQGK